MPTHLRNLIGRISGSEFRLPAGNDLFWLAGSALFTLGVAELSVAAALMVGGALLLVVAIGGTRAR